MPMIDNDFFKLLFRFGINMVFITMIVRWIYYPNNRKVHFLFSYYLIGTIVFFICFTLKKNNLELGLALGLFAIFGILRYRTDATPVKEMTYIFIVIGLSVINALVNKKVSFTEWMFVNLAVVALTYGIERIWFVGIELQKQITYEKIDLVLPERYAELLEDVRKRTGLDVTRVEVGNMDFMRDAAQLTVFYRPNTSVQNNTL